MEQGEENRCKSCVWNERVKCGKYFCMLPRCVKMRRKGRVRAWVQKENPGNGSRRMD